VGLGARRRAPDTIGMRVSPNAIATTTSGIVPARQGPHRQIEARDERRWPRCRRRAVS
jgi:hypothetical protein